VHGDDPAFADLVERQDPFDGPGVIAAEQNADGHTGTLFSLRRGFDALHQHFGVVAVDDGQDIDLHAVAFGDLGLLFGVAEVLVAVADENDAFGSSFREGGDGQLDGGADVGVVGIDGAADVG